MRAAPRAIASAGEAASDRKLDLLTLAPRHELKSFAERLMLPCGLYLLGFYQNLERVQAPESDEVVATGQFMLLRREAYDAVGGHAMLLRASEEVRRNVDVFHPANGGVAALSERVRSSFDPKGILNRGRMVRGLLA